MNSNLNQNIPATPIPIPTPKKRTRKIKEVSETPVQSPTEHGDIIIDELQQLVKDKKRVLSKINELKKEEDIQTIKSKELEARAKMYEFLMSNSLSQYKNYKLESCLPSEMQKKKQKEKRVKEVKEKINMIVPDLEEEVQDTLANTIVFE